MFVCSKRYVESWQVLEHRSLEGAVCTLGKYGVRSVWNQAKDMFPSQLETLTKLSGAMAQTRSSAPGLANTVAQQATPVLMAKWVVYCFRRQEAH